MDKILITSINFVGQDNILIMPVPRRERKLPEYAYLKKCFGVKMCTNEKRSEIPFYCDTTFSIFAVDSYGNYIGTFEDVGTLAEDDFKVGIVNPLYKTFGVITDSIRQFLELIISCPDWYSTITGAPPLIPDFEFYKEAAYYLANTFNLEQHENILQNVSENICNTTFVVYEEIEGEKKYYNLVHII